MKNTLRTYNRALNDLKQFKPIVSGREETIKTLKNSQFKTDRNSMYLHCFYEFLRF